MSVLLCWVTQDFELYAAFDPLADKVFFCIYILKSFSVFKVQILSSLHTEYFSVQEALKFHLCYVQALAIKTCNRVCQWVKDVENEIFLQGASPFSW